MVINSYEIGGLMLYYRDPYLKETEVEILERRGNEYRFSDTIFYPGGGGQPADKGYVLCGNRKIGVRHKGNLWHILDEDCPLSRVTLLLDWEWRYYLMRAHSAEHAFFRFLQNMGDARLGKANFGDVSSIVFEGDLDIHDILEAEEQLRELISKGAEIRDFWIPKDEVDMYPQLRIRKERIKEDRIRIVEIVGHDVSACKGIHVRNLSEVGDFAVTSFRAGKKKEVKFVVGEKARKYHLQASKTLREVMWPRNLNMDTLAAYLQNLEKGMRDMEEALREMSAKIPFEKVKCKGDWIYYLYLPAGNYKVLQRRAMEIANHEDIPVLYGIGKNVVCLAYPAEKEFFRKEYLQLLRSEGGKGGGKGNFVSGSAPDAKKFVEKFVE